MDYSTLKIELDEAWKSANASWLREIAEILQAKADAVEQARAMDTEVEILREQGLL